MAKSTTPWSEIRGDLTPEQEREVEQLAAASLDAVALAELRASRGVTQVQLAETLELNQSSISGLERRSDAYLSTLSEYIEGLGGKLKLSAVFPEGETVIRLGAWPKPAGTRTVWKVKRTAAAEG